MSAYVGAVCANWAVVDVDDVEKVEAPITFVFGKRTVTCCGRWGRNLKPLMPRHNFTYPRQRRRFLHNPKPSLFPKLAQSKSHIMGGGGEKLPGQYVVSVLESLIPAF